ncbi:MAG: cytochrome b/b6 domain-containing protein [Thermodesulfobacteriota bacterium]
MSSLTVVRHSLTVRLTHWTIALSGILLLFSGFGQMPMYKRYNVVKIPGLGWSDQYDITLMLHYFGAIFFCAAVIFHIVYHIRRKEYAIMPKTGDIGVSITGFKAMFGMAEEPLHAKFQAKQRVIYAIIGAVCLILVGTGVIKSYKNLGDIILQPMFLEAMTMLHTAFGMLFMALFIAHVAALTLKDHRPLVPSMFTGNIDRKYAEEHLPEWKID